MKLSFPTKLTKVNAQFSVLRAADAVTYHKNGELIFIHDLGDKVAFRFIVCQLCITGAVTQAEIIRVFKISRSSLSGWINGYKKRGAKALYRITKSTLRAGVGQKRRSRKLTRSIDNVIGQAGSKRNSVSKIYL
jgi:hypothetical protein